MTTRLWIIAIFLTFARIEPLLAQTASEELDSNPASVLDDRQWRAVDTSVDRALVYLGKQQRRDGSFPGSSIGQPGISSLGAMAILSRGYRPGEGPYGKRLEKAIDYVLSKQTKTGFFTVRNVEPYIPRDLYGANWDHSRSAAFYNHAIASLMLTELYGMSNEQQQKRMKVAIEKALALTRKYQRNKVRTRDEGGWRYMFHNNNAEADLSVTAWQLMFLRSAKNAGFDIPKEYIDDAMGFVHRCYDEDRKRFRYAFSEGRYTRAMSGAGILSLSLGGEHETPAALGAADSLLTDSFDRYNDVGPYHHGRYHYSVYYATLGMFQMGGKHWEKFYPPIVEVLIKNQNRDGSWGPESGGDSMFGAIHTTSMMVMCLTIADQMVPVYQR